MMTSALWNEGVSNDMLLCDHLTIELRDATTFSMLASGDALLYTDGFADISFPAQAANAYIVVKHRNAIQTWSALPMSMNSGTVSYDFSTAATQAYGQNEVEAESGVWALYSGDLVADENIDLLDCLPWRMMSIS